MPFALANILALGDQRLLAEFTALTVPAFSATVKKHWVEYHIITAGLPDFAKARQLDPAKLATK